MWLSNVGRTRNIIGKGCIWEVFHVADRAACAFFKMDWIAPGSRYAAARESFTRTDVIYVIPANSFVSGI